MASGPASKGSYAQYTQSGTGNAHPHLYTNRADYVAHYYKEVPQGRGKVSRKKTRAQNPATAHHFHASNRLAAAAHTDAWHNKDRARGQR